MIPTAASVPLTAFLRMLSTRKRCYGSRTKTTSGQGVCEMFDVVMEDYLTVAHAHRMDVHYDKDTNNVNVTFELPGLQKEDVSIDVHNNVLTVSGEDKTSSERSEDGYVIRERRYGKFSRSLSLPQGLKVSTSVIPI